RKNSATCSQRSARTFALSKSGLDRAQVLFSIRWRCSVAPCVLLVYEAHFALFGSPAFSLVPMPVSLAAGIPRLCRESRWRFAPRKRAVPQRTERSLQQVPQRGWHRREGGPRLVVHW